jgi:hypothetical protein
MSRLLQPTIRVGFRDGTNPPDEFGSRIAKFIPSETGTLFTIVNAYLLEMADKLPPDQKKGLSSVIFAGITLFWWSVIVFIVSFLANWILLDRLFEKQFASAPFKKELKRKHIAASSIGFILWAYSIRSPIFVNFYAPFLAVLSVGVFLIICWQIKPPEVEPVRKALSEEASNKGQAA